jgi:hypothetical protein
VGIGSAYYFVVVVVVVVVMILLLLLLLAWAWNIGVIVAEAAVGGRRWRFSFLSSLWGR